MAAAIDAGARAADRRGAPAAAAELLERAASLTPDDDRATAAHRRVDAARHHISAGDERRGVDICRALVAELRPGPLRAEALRTLASSAHIPVNEAIASGRRAVDECGDDPELRVNCLLRLADAVRGDDFRAALAIAEDALATARTASRPALAAALTSVGGLETMMTPGGGREMLRDALAIVPRSIFPPRWWDPAIVLGNAHLFADELDEARSLLEPARKRAMDAGDEVNAQDADRTLAQVELGAGNLAAARALAEEAVAIGDEGEPSWSLSGHLFARALVAAHEGDADLARELAARGLSMAEEVGDEVFPFHHRSVLGSLELSLGNPAEAVSHLEPLPGQLARLGVREPREPGAFVPYADAVEALIGVGRIEEAEARIEVWEELGRAIDRPRLLATGARARGLIAAERGDLDRAVVALEEAIGHHERLPGPDRAWPHADRSRRRIQASGAAPRRPGDAGGGVRALRANRRPDLGRSRSGRARPAGGRAPSSDELTPTERRVAELVVEGRTNKEVASALFVTVRTVEANLTRIYSKLGVRSRTELAAREARANDESSA